MKSAALGRENIEKCAHSHTHTHEHATQIKAATRSYALFTALLLPLRTFLTHPIFSYFARWFFFCILLSSSSSFFCVYMRLVRVISFASHFFMSRILLVRFHFHSEYVCARTYLSASRYSTYQSCLHQSNHCRLFGGSTEQNKGIIFVTLYANDVCVFFVIILMRYAQIFYTICDEQQQQPLFQ